MNTQPEKSFLAKLKERKVVRVGLVYILVGWILIQIGETTFEALILPDWSMALLIVLVFLGFPIALVLAWAAYQGTPQGASAQRAAEGGLDNTAPSIAVLPFIDLSEHGDQAHFCEGIAEEILNALAQVKELKVAGRTSSFAFKGRPLRLIIERYAAFLGFVDVETASTELLAGTAPGKGGKHVRHQGNAKKYELFHDSAVNCFQ